MRRSFAGLVLTVLLAACGGPAPTPVQSPSDGAETLHGQVLDGAREVAGQVEDRYAELESMLP